MILLVDTNIIISSLIRDSIIRRIIIDDNLRLFVPEYTLDEIRKHKNEVCKKADISEFDFDILLSLIFSNITVVPSSEYHDHMTKAKKIIGKYDVTDVPFVACCLALKADGIWTEDKDFKKQKTVNVFTTKDILRIMYE
jgi:predicted nucleic acid-binding protein